MDSNIFQVAQAEYYRDELSKYLPSNAAFQIMMVGKGRDSNLNVNRLAQNISVHSYKDLISTARSQIFWLHYYLLAEKKKRDSF